ncbi:MAG: hypothetical protein JJE42_08745 [Burkholderiales bacterium]|nr:hypothetical protein [Burkholderiales bacterium]
MLIYLLAEDVPDDSLGYVIANGTLHPLSTRDSKAYRREVQRFGGKGALALDDFSRWFAELWRGKTLGKTVAWISVLASLAIYLFSNYLGPDTTRDSKHRRERDGPD